MAGRKEYELLFKLQAALGGNFNTVFQSALNTTKQMQNSLTKLNSITGKIDAYKKQEAALESNRQKLERLTAEHDKLQREMSETAAPSEELRQKMAKNEKQIAATTAKIEAQEQRLQTLGSELSAAGVNTANLSAENERLAKTYDKVKKSQEELAKVSAALEQNNAAISQTKTQLAGTLGTLAALGGAIYAGPVKKAAEFEAQMSTVKAISNASADDMKRLSEEAKHMGATTKFTAVEAGKALEYMAMAGWKTDQMLGGLPGIMNLAAASGEDLGQVSDIVTDALTAFNMTADQSGRFADVLAQASSNANTNVSMMGSTFQKVALLCGRYVAWNRFDGECVYQGRSRRHKPKDGPCEHGKAHKANASLHGQVRNQPDKCGRKHEDVPRGHRQSAVQFGRAFRIRTGGGGYRHFRQRVFRGYACYRKRK